MQLPRPQSTQLDQTRGENARPDSLSWRSSGCSTRLAPANRPLHSSCWHERPLVFEACSSHFWSKSSVQTKGVEVEWSVFERYLAVYEEDATAEPPHPASIANRPKGYESIVGVPANIQFGIASQRPRIVLPANSEHQLAIRCHPWHLIGAVPPHPRRHWRGGTSRVVGTERPLLGKLGTTAERRVLAASGPSCAPAAGNHFRRHLTATNPPSQSGVPVALR